MTTIFSKTSATGITATDNNQLRIFRWFTDATRRFFARREAKVALSQLDDTQLRDIGIDPAQVGRGRYQSVDAATNANLMSMR